MNDIDAIRNARTNAVPAGGVRLFPDFFLGGFECSCHALEDGRRLDLTSATQHDVLAELDYARARAVGLGACRDGISWVRAEPSAGRHDFSAALPLLQGARRYGVQVIWDLMHFGWPADVDLFSPRFPARFGRHAAAFARWLAGESDGLAMITPINEMSFLAWAGGDVGCMNPFASARGVELKVQLVRATMEAIDAIRAVIPGARFLQPEPAIHIVADPAEPLTWRRVECDNLLQYQAWDMLVGSVWPSLGGHPRYLDIVGVNFYPNNQFMLDGTTIWPGDPRYRPFSDLLQAVWSRYRRPMLISETGSEGEHRAPWLRAVCDECALAMQQGCEIHGITLYPVLNHPGWADDRRCENGLWDYADAHGNRELHAPLLDEMRAQSPRLRALRDAVLEGAAPVAIPA